MPLKFGTSGIRGLATEFNDKEVYLLVTAFLKYVNAPSADSSVFTAMDLRESSPRILKAAHRAISDHKGKVNTCGQIPTPALAYYAQSKNSLSLMITGSHIPADRNGIKFYLRSGETLKDDDDAIFKLYLDLKATKYCSELFDAHGTFKQNHIVEVQDHSDAAKMLYNRRYDKFFGIHSLKGIKVLVYQHSSVARDLLLDVLKNLGAVAIPVGRSDTFIPVDTEAVSSIDQFKSWIEEFEADALVSTDGDGDRPLVIDNQGNLIQGDKLGIICAQYLSIEAIALPISCNTSVEQIPAFKKISFTKIGSPYVIEALNNLAKSYGTVAGFEANGGFILKSTIADSACLEQLATRDATLPIVTFLATAVQKKLRLNQVIEMLPHRYTSSILIKDTPLEQSIHVIEHIVSNPQNVIKEIIPSTSDEDLFTINTLDGVRITTAQNEILHFRPSGNAPEFRCYTEASSQRRADELSTKTQRLIKELLLRY